jgi:hypothetical protein
MVSFSAPQFNARSWHWESRNQFLVFTPRLSPVIPIFCSLDVHAMMTTTFIEISGALVGSKTAPQVNKQETCQHIARAVVSNIRSIHHNEYFFLSA